MYIATRLLMPWLTATVALIVLSCSKEESKAESSRSAANPAQLATPSAPTNPPTPNSTAGQLPVECPKGSSGLGSFEKPCEATGTARMMEVTWTGKFDDKGPSFEVKNLSQSDILYGKITVYFYDKAGKQLIVQPTSTVFDKPHPYRTCGGNLFGHVMKPGESAVLSFQCVKKQRVPEGAAAIEAEMQVVGFPDSSGKTVAYFWRNLDLAPEARSKPVEKK